MSNSTWSKHMEYVAQLEQTLAENGLLDWWRGEQAKSDDGKFKETKRRKIGKKKQHNSLISTTTYNLLEGTSEERSEAIKEFNKNNSTEGILDNQIRYFESWLKSLGFPTEQEECNCWAIGLNGEKLQTRLLQSEVKHLAGDDNPLPVYAVNALVHAREAKKAYALEDYKHASWNIAKMAEYSHKHTVSRMEEKWHHGNEMMQGRKIGSFHPVKKKILAILRKKPTLKNEAVWKALEMDPPRGWELYPKNNFFLAGAGRRIEGPGAEEWSHSKFIKACSEVRKFLKDNQKIPG